MQSMCNKTDRLQTKNCIPHEPSMPCNLSEQYTSLWSAIKIFSGSAWSGAQSEALAFRSTSTLFGCAAMDNWLDLLAFIFSVAYNASKARNAKDKCNTDVWVQRQVQLNVSLVNIMSMLKMQWTRVWHGESLYFLDQQRTHTFSYNKYIDTGSILPYASGEVRMDPRTEVCLYPCGSAACAPRPWEA